MNLTEVFIGLGGNIGDTQTILQQSLKLIGVHPEIFELSVSKYYLTTPVSPLPQNMYVNAVARLKTSLNAVELFRFLQEIEQLLGKTPKHKNAPRMIDLDILFFGTTLCEGKELEIPHPRWSERLFVLIPLADLVTELDIPSSQGIIRINIHQLLKEFANIHNETVSLLQEEVAI